MFADLHLHTTFSDGTFSPEELATHAKRHDLAAIALTDHDTVEGCTRMAAACASEGIEFIPGTELTAGIQGMEIHILGYGMDTGNAKLLAETAKYQLSRQERIREMVACLNRLGISLAVETVFALANCQSPGRPHLARALVQEGYCADPDEAFERFLKAKRPAWVPRAKIEAHEAISLIHHAGGVAVIAHPGLNRTDNFIEQLVEAGLDGIECFHTKHSNSQSAHYLKVAARHRLLITGGSDCHGLSKGKPLIGSMKISRQYVEELNARAAARKAPVIASSKASH